MKLSRSSGTFCAWLLALLLLTLSHHARSAVELPAGLVQKDVPGAWGSAVGVVAGPDANGSRRLYVWEAYGKVWIVQDGVRLSTPLIDIGPEIGNYISLLGFTLDPNFQSNGYIYLLYTVDRNVLLGSPGGTGIPLIERSHGMGCLQFSRDGTLLVSTGDAAGGSDTVADLGGSPNAIQAVADGIIPAAQNVGAWRAQLLDCMSGKILRINPNTGDGIASNPFYQSAAPATPRSRVWAYGLRNPFRFTIKPGSDSLQSTDGKLGTIVLGDAGWNTEDSLMVCSAGGQNFGWPAYEGFSPSPGYSTAVPPAGVSLSGRVQPMAAWSPASAKARVGNSVYPMGTAGSPIAGSNFGGRASIGGTYLPDTSNWPDALKGQYLHMDWGSTAADSGWVKLFGGVGGTTYADGLQRVTGIAPFGGGWQGVSHLYTDPQDSVLYYVVWPNIVRQVVPAPATLPGLLQERYAGNTFSGTPVVSVVSSLSFGSGLPAGLNSTRWTGFITPQVTDNYKFYMDANDRAKVWINDQLVLNVGTLNDGVDDYWLAAGSTLTLTAGVRYSVKVEHANDGGNGVAVLFWASPTTTLTAIPDAAFSYAPDTTPPTVNLSAPTTANGAFPVAVQSADVLYDLANTDFIVTGGSVTSLTFANNAWSATVLPSAGATSVSVKLPAGTCRDQAGNYNTASNTVVTTIGSGTAGPVPTLTNETAGPQTVGGFGLGLVWSEAVEGFTASDVVVTNGTLTSLTAVERSKFIISVKPTAAGPVTVKIPAGVCTNLSRTASNAASTLISTSYIAETNAPGLLSEYFFGTDFETQLYSLSGGNVQMGWGLTGPSNPLGGNFADYFSVRYSGTLTPQFTETYRLLVDSDDGVRVYLNDALILDSWSTVGIRWQQPSLPINLMAGQKYNFRLEHRDNTGHSEVYLFWQSASQPVSIIPNAAFQHTTTADVTPPSVTLSGPATVNVPGTGPAPFEVIVSPSEPVTGLEATDFVLSNCLLNNTSSQQATFVGRGDGTYALRLLAGQGAFSVRLPAGACTDTSGNPNAPSAVYSGVRSGGDTTPPSLTLTGPATGNVGVDRLLGLSALFELKVTPSEPVSGLDLSDFVFTGCTPRYDGGNPNPQLGPPAADGTYTLYLNATAVNFSVSVMAGSYVDALNNPGLASNTYNGVRLPGATLYAPVTATGNFVITTELIINSSLIAPADYIVTNGTAVAIAPGVPGRDYTSYQVTIQPTASGPVTVKLGGRPFGLPSTTIVSNTTTTNATPSQRPNGVTINYFNDTTLTNNVLSTVGSNINFDWAENAPAPAVPANQFSARFTGCVVPPTSGVYTIKVNADDGARLWINNVLAFDNFNAQGGSWTANFTATAGTPVPIKLEYREGWGGAAVIMSWSGPSVPLQIIPSSRWLVNETSLTLPVLITAQEDQAAVDSQIPASYRVAVEHLKEIGSSMQLSPEARTLTWECPATTVPYLTVEQSDDLQQWTPLTTAQTPLTSPSAGTARLQISLPPVVGPIRFYRLRAKP